MIQRASLTRRYAIEVRFAKNGAAWGAEGGVCFNDEPPSVLLRRLDSCRKPFDGEIRAIG